MSNINQKYPLGHCNTESFKHTFPENKEKYLSQKDVENSKNHTIMGCVRDTEVGKVSNWGEHFLKLVLNCCVIGLELLLASLIYTITGSNSGPTLNLFT